MGIERIWPLGFAVLIPGIILLYLLKQKMQKHTVPALNLWKEAYENMQAVTPWEKFRHHLLMYLQIFALLLLIAALVVPMIRLRGSNHSRVVICIDQSGSMNGSYSKETTKLEEAKVQAKELVRQLKFGTRITLLTSGKAARLLASDVTDQTRLCSLIEQIAPSDVQGNLQSGVRMTESISKQWEDYQFVGFTDENIDLGDLSGEVVDLSSSYENCGISWVTHREEESGVVQIQAKIENYGKQSVKQEVNLYLGGELYDVQEVRVNAGESQIVSFHDLSAGRFQKTKEKEGYLRAELNHEDGLEADNQGFEILQDSGEKHVLLVTQQNSFLEKALKSQEGVILEKTTSVENINPNRSYDVIVYDGIMPKKWYGKENILLINPRRDLAIDQKRLVTIQSTKKNKSVSVPEGELTEGLESFTVGCGKTEIFRVPDWAYSFLDCEGESAGYTGYLKGRNITVLGFDLHQSELPVQMEFPILMYHIMEQGEQTDSLSSCVLEPEETAELLGNEENETVVWQMPDGDRETGTVTEGRALYSKTYRAGLYGVRYEKGSDRENKWFSVNFPSEESIVKQGIQVKQGGKKVQKAKAGTEELYEKISLQKPILCLLLLLLCAEWLIYRKRI